MGRQQHEGGGHSDSALPTASWQQHTALTTVARLRSSLLQRPPQSGSSTQVGATVTPLPRCLEVTLHVFEDIYFGDIPS